MIFAYSIYDILYIIYPTHSNNCESCPTQVSSGKSSLKVCPVCPPKLSLTICQVSSFTWTMTKVLHTHDWQKSKSTTILHTSDGLTNRSAWDVASCVFLKNKLQTPISGWEPQWLLSAGWHTPPPSGFQLHKLGHDDHDDDHDGGDDDHDDDDFDGDELHNLCHLATGLTNSQMGPQNHPLACSYS